MRLTIVGQFLGLNSRGHAEACLGEAPDVEKTIEKMHNEDPKNDTGKEE
jgi:hypothetical protein